MNQKSIIYITDLNIELFGSK